MRRLFAFFLIFALVGASAFAQFKFSGAFEVRATLAAGDFNSDEISTVARGGSWMAGGEPFTGVYRDFQLGLQGETPNGIFGGKVIMHRTQDFAAYLWWKPLEMLMIKMGNIWEDSTWAGADIADWGLHSNDFSVRATGDFVPHSLNSTGPGVNKDVPLPSGNGFFANSMAGINAEKAAVQISVYPVEGLSVNLGFPVAKNVGLIGLGEWSSDGMEVVEAYLDHLHTQVVYDAGVGEVAVSFVNAPETGTKNIYAQWKMPIGDTMRIEFGANYGIEAKNAAKEPIRIGLGWGMGSLDNEDQLVLTSRIGALVPMEDGQDTVIGLDFVVSYDLGVGRLYVPIGLGFTLADEFVLDWGFNPYFTKDLGGPFFYAGLQLYSTQYRKRNPNPTGGTPVFAKMENTINWAIPIGFRWDF